MNYTNEQLSARRNESKASRSFNRKMSLGLTVLAAAGIGIGFKEAKADNSLMNNLNQPIAAVKHELAIGKINKDQVVTVEASSFEHTWDMANQVTKGTDNTNQVSDIITAQDGTSVAPGTEAVVPKSDVPQ